MFLLADATLRSDGAFRRDVALFQADEAHVEFICLVHPFVDGHLSEGVAAFRFMQLSADKALIGRDRKSTRLNSSHSQQSRMPSSA